MAGLLLLIFLLVLLSEIDAASASSEAVVVAALVAVENLARWWWLALGRFLWDKLRAENAEACLVTMRLATRKPNITGMARPIIF
jgi:hypothetical protein